MSRHTSIPLVDLGSQYALIKHEIDQAIAHTIANSEFIGGPALARFEQKFAEFCHARAAVGVGSGTDALELILEALGIGPGDEVIIPSMTFAATGEAVVRVGATPVIVDVSERTLNIDPQAATLAVSKSTKAILAVHLYGQPADLDALSDLAKAAGVELVEDAAQAHGASWNGQRVGAIGRAAGFSFYPGKNLGAYGDAGAVVTNDQELADRVRLVANHGRTAKYSHEVVGRNSRLDGLQAAILEVKLAYMDRWNMRRREIAERYASRLKGSVEFVAQDARADSVYHLFVAFVPDRDRVRDDLAERGISTGVHYPIPLHRQPAFAEYVAKDQDKKWAADTAAERILSLPMFPELSNDDIDHIAEELLDVLQARSRRSE